MNLLTTQDLLSVGLNTDGVTGFEAQVALKTTRQNAAPPDHFTGTRTGGFEEGAAMARSWMDRRNSMGVARRRARLQERKSGDFITTMRPRGNAERREEQLQALKSVAEMRARVATRLVDAQAIETTRKL